MNADNRTDPPSRGAFTPEPTSTPAPRTGGNAQTTPSGQVPQRTSLRSGQFPTQRTGAPTHSGQNPTTQRAAAPTTTRPFPGVTSPVTGTPTTAAPLTGAPVVRPASAGAGTDTDDAGISKIKGFALKAKDSLTEADDAKAAKTKGGPRKVRVLLSRVDPWSALKIGFLLSIAAGIMLTVATYVTWNVLNQMGIPVLANEWVSKLFTEGQEVNLLQFFELNKWMSAAVLVSVVNVVLLTALSTVMAFLYNVVSSVVGGIYLTLTDD